MKRKRFTEEQIMGILREYESSAKTGDLARKHGISEATLYNGKAKFGRMDVSDAKQLRALEDETGVTVVSAPCARALAAFRDNRSGP